MPADTGSMRREHRVAATCAALRLGHPEEVLGAGLVVLASLWAVEGRSPAAGVALGLALATKQWAVIAALPVIAAAPRQRLRLAAVALGVVALLTVPVMV